MTDRARIAIFTVIEVAALVIWLALVRAGMAILGLVVLFAGLVIEHILAFNVVNGRRLADVSGVPVKDIAVFSAVETAIWAVWLTVYERSSGLAGVLLAGLLVVEHTLSDNVFRRRPLLEMVISRRTVGFSIVEAVAATSWLGLVMRGKAAAAIVALAVGSFVEHTMAVRTARTAR